MTNCITSIAVGSEELHVLEPNDGVAEAAVSEEDWGLRLIARAGCGGRAARSSRGPEGAEIKDLVIPEWRGVGVGGLGTGVVH